MTDPIAPDELLPAGELLLRQIDERFVDPETSAVQSSAFAPKKDDNGHMSVDRAVIWTCEESFHWYSRNFSRDPVGTAALLVQECLETGQREGKDLPALATPIKDKNPAHASIDFTRFTKSKMKKLAKILRHKAHARGWQYPPRLKGTTFPISGHEVGD